MSADAARGKISSLQEDTHRSGLQAVSHSDLEKTLLIVGEERFLGLGILLRWRGGLGGIRGRWSDLLGSHDE